MFESCCPSIIHEKCHHLIKTAQTAGLSIATAESCTGGLLSASLTGVSGSSAVMIGSIVSYANDMKQEILDVPSYIIEKYGAVSEPVAMRMAEGILNKTHAHIAVSITGVAGPDGGSVQKPVGLVRFALAYRVDPQGGIMITPSQRQFDPVSRESVRWQSVLHALDLLQKAVDALSSHPSEKSTAPLPHYLKNQIISG
jgi:nicotinamide-nucleotide amidase